ncbi:MAG: heme ABC exporter ATP-binding protein CcmA [Longimicrobiales bacterium]
MAEHHAQGDSAIELNGVARRFGARWALRGVDLRVERGSVVALRGRNGSGKTTLLRVGATLLRPSRGSVTVFGVDAAEDADRIRGLVGFLTHRTGLYDDLTAAENLRFAARMMGVGSAPDEIFATLERVGLGDVADERVRGFSSGMQRRLAFARLLLRRPALLLLDEPYASFDAEAVELVNGFAREVVQNGGAALIATHDETRADGVADREVWLEAGRLIGDEPLLGAAPQPGTRNMRGARRVAP